MSFLQSKNLYLYEYHKGCVARYYCYENMIKFTEGRNRTHSYYLGFEFHLKHSRNGYSNDLVTTIGFIETLNLLYFKGNYRLISYDPNGCWQNMGETSGSYYNLAEIVLMKIDTDMKCTDPAIDVSEKTLIIRNGYEN